MPSRRDMLHWILGASVAGAAPIILNTSCLRDDEKALTELLKDKNKAAVPPRAPASVASLTKVSPREQIVVPKPALRPPIKNLTIRRSADRGHFDYGWLKTNHSFSFSRYYDPKHMGFRALRVINEDVIQAKGGFPMHPHRDMEIITYIIRGALQHRDSIGNGSIIRPGEIQRMSAGTGIRHSEFNPSGLASVHLLQIWLRPNRRGHRPSYAQQIIPQTSSPNPVRLIASPNGDDGSITLNQDVKIYACLMGKHQEMHFEVRPKRHAWVQIARGNLTVNGKILKQGDGFSTSDDGWLTAYANRESELLVFDLS